MSEPTDFKKLVAGMNRTIQKEIDSLRRASFGESDDKELAYINKIIGLLEFAKLEVSATKQHITTLEARNKELEEALIKSIGFSYISTHMWICLSCESTSPKSKEDIHHSSSCHGSVLNLVEEEK